MPIRLPGLIAVSMATALLGSFLALPRTQGQETAPAKRPPESIGSGKVEPQYLLFQHFIYDPGNPQPFDKTRLTRIIDDVVGQLGGLKGDGKTRFLGIAVGPMTLNHTDAELRTIIRESFEVAVNKRVAIAFHIDDSMFWHKRKDLSDDPKNIEWTDWKGTALKHRFIGWAPMLHAPQICYDSPVIRKEIGRIAKDVIGEEIRKGTDRLKRMKLDYLFAGVIAGWETHLADYRYIPKDDPNVTRLFGKDGYPRSPIGYCALTSRGFSASNPPRDFHYELERVVHDWIELWAKKLNEAGISKDRIYTHIAPVPDQRFLTPELAQKNFLGFRMKDFSLSGLEGHAAPWTAFNDYSRPGFSTYSAITSADGGNAFVLTLYDELRKHGNPHWASSEGTNVNPEMPWERYLGEMFNHGATLVTIFAWQDADPQFGKFTRSKDALEAYKKFLRGGSLSESSGTAASVAGATGSLQAKIKKLQERLPSWVRSGPGNQAKVTPLMEKLDQYLRANKAHDAEALVDEILGLVGP